MTPRGWRSSCCMIQAQPPARIALSVLSVMALSFLRSPLDAIPGRPRDQGAFRRRSRSLLCLATTRRSPLSLSPACSTRDPAPAECWIPCKARLSVAIGSQPFPRGRKSRPSCDVPMAPRLPERLHERNRTPLPDWLREYRHGDSKYRQRGFLEPYSAF